MLGFHQKSQCQVTFEGILVKNQPWIENDGQPSDVFNEAIGLCDENNKKMFEIQNFVESRVKCYETNNKEVDVFFLK